ncbi:MAG: hypothetical protein ACYC8T_15975 [Myxococcaceae bacterium]
MRARKGGAPVQPQRPSLEKDRAAPPSRPAARPQPPPPGFERTNREDTSARLNPGPLPPPPPPGGQMFGGVVLRGPSASAAAAAEGRRALEMLTRRPDIQERLRAARVSMVIIPADKKLTDMPEFASLRGRRTFDGRLWDDVRGVGGTSVKDRSIAFGVAEETLAHLPGDTYPRGYNVAVHELAHVIHNTGLPACDKDAIDEAYLARKAAGGPWTEAYGSSNAFEYFAQGTNAFFGKNQGMGENGAPWVKQNDPALYRLLERVFGPAPA